MTLFDAVYSIFLLIVFTIVLTSLVYEKRARISPTPVLPHVRKRALGLVPDSLTDAGAHTILDLGCGWGGLVISLARLFPNARIIGYEISPWPYLFSKIKGLIHSRNISIKREDFFKKDISGANLVFCYLSPYHMNALKEKLRTLAKGSCVISCSFPITGWEPDRTETVKGLFVDIPVYRYTIPA